MELKHLFVLVAGIFANFIAAMKMIENDRLKKENKKLKQKLGMDG